MFSRKPRLLTILSLAHFVVDFYSLFLPIFIPVLVRLLGISYFQAGILMAGVAVMGTVLHPAVGYWADLYRKRVAFIGLGFLLYALGAVTLSLSRGFYLLLLSSLFIGLANTTYHPQSTNLIVKEFQRKGQALGIHGVVGQLGRFVAPMLIALLISRLTWRVAALTLTLPALLALLLTQFTLKEPKEKGERGLIKAIRPSMILLIVIMGLRGAIFQGIMTFLPSFLVNTGSSLNKAGVLTGVMLGAGLIAQPLAGELSDRIYKGKIIFFSLAGLTGFFLLFLLLITHPQSSSSSYSLWLTPLLLGMGFCIFATFPIGLAFSAELTRGERIGTSVGAVTGGGLIISTTALPVTGYLIDNFGFTQGFTFLAILSLIATLLSTSYLRSRLRNLRE